MTVLSNNSLYPGLRRFEQAGAVTKRVEKNPGHPSRNVFAITDLGRELFRELISTLPVELASSSEEFLLRLGFFAELGTSERLAILAARDAALAAQVDQLSTLIAQMTGSVAGDWRSEATEHLLDQLIRDRSWVAELTRRVHDDETSEPRTIDEH